MNMKTILSTVVLGSMISLTGCYDVFSKTVEKTEPVEMCTFVYHDGVGIDPEGKKAIRTPDLFNCRNTALNGCALHGKDSEFTSYAIERLPDNTASVYKIDPKTFNNITYTNAHWKVAPCNY